MQIFVMTYSNGKLKMVGPFSASTAVAQVQQAQIWCSKWAAANTKSGEIPQWWIVEQDVAESATSVEVPLEAPAD